MNEPRQKGRETRTPQSRSRFNEEGSSDRPSQTLMFVRALPPPAAAQQVPLKVISLEDNRKKILEDC